MADTSPEGYDSQELYNAITYPLVEVEQKKKALEGQADSLYDSIVYPRERNGEYSNNDQGKRKSNFESPATLILPRKKDKGSAGEEPGDDSIEVDTENTGKKKPDPSNIWKLLGS